MTRRLSEKEFQAQVVDLARWHGWRVFHDYDSRRNAPGWPDLVLANRKLKRVLFRELKSDVGRVRPEQKEWLTDLTNAGLDAAIWRPRDMPRIQKELGGR